IANPNRILSHAEKGRRLIDTLSMIYKPDTSHLLQKIPFAVDSMLLKPKVTFSKDSLNKEMMDSDSGMVEKDKMSEEIPEMEDKMLVDSTEKEELIAVDSMHAKTDSIAPSDTKSKRKKKKKAEEKLVEKMEEKPTRDSIAPVVEPTDSV